MKKIIELGPEVGKGEQRDIYLKREIHFLQKDFAERFIKIADPDIVEVLDKRIKNMLGVY
ncbi:hypothetical protein V7068_21570 [Bacillus sp. JJ634]